MTHGSYVFRDANGFTYSVKERNYIIHDKYVFNIIIRSEHICVRFEKKKKKLS